MSHLFNVKRIDNIDRTELYLIYFFLFDFKMAEDQTTHNHDTPLRLVKVIIQLTIFHR